VRGELEAVVADQRNSHLRGAILGAGNVAIEGHLPGWLAREDVAIVAAADPRPAAREALAERLPKVRRYETAEELFSREALDFADICAPPAMHARLIAAALEKGLHVLCEKPLVLAADELAPLRETALRKDRALAAVHNWRHAPVLAAAQTLLAEGAIGEVRFCCWETLREKPAAAAGDTGQTNWRVDPAVSGGGILMDHGWHALYVVLGWLPDMPRRVSGRLSTRRHREWPIEDTAELVLECGGGERAEILLTWAADERRNRATIQGTRGTIRLDGSVLHLTTIGSAEPIVPIVFPDSLSEGSHHPGWFAGVAAEFLSEIRDPARRGRSLAEASACLETIGLARESSLRGGAALSAAREAWPARAPARSAAP
jgi:predicted dehydrogenase